MSIKYRQLSVRCCCSVTPLREAALQLQPARIYTLHVGEKAYFDGKDAAAGAMEEGNPFSPYINVKIDPSLTDTEWYLEDEQGNACGSPGV